MPKKITGYIKTQVPAGGANPSPPITSWRSLEPRPHALVALRICPAFLALAALTSCNSVPAYQRPDLQLPPDWFPTQDHQETFLREWWSGFGDANLPELVERSRTNNLDIRATVQRLLQAQAQMRVARGSLFPFLTLGGSVEGVRKSGDSQSGAE